MSIITPTREELKEACKMLQFNINMPSIIEYLNENDVDYRGWTDLEMIRWYLENGGPINESLNEGTWALPKSSQERKDAALYFTDIIERLKKEIYPVFGDDILFDEFDGAIRRIEELSAIPEEEITESLNEDVTIPPQLANQYLTVKKQMADKQSKRDQLMKSVNQVDNEMNILNKNLIAIETKAAELQGKEVEAQGEKVQGTQTVEVQGNVKESLDIDEWWRENVSEAMNDESDDTFDLDQDIYDRNPDYDVEGDREEFDEEEDVEDEDSLEGDYVFAVKVIDGDEEEDIIAKFYRDEEEDFWKARVVQGSEEPIESMQFDPEMEKLDIIEHLATIYDEVEEIDTDDYEEMLDDKEVIDDIFYDDIVK